MSTTTTTQLPFHEWYDRVRSDAQKLGKEKILADLPDLTMNTFHNAYLAGCEATVADFIVWCEGPTGWCNRF